ncbi:MAG: hypothetical protein DCC67_02070, partial [Planctomycetota bacterium]
MLFDTHVHLDQDEFAGDRDGVVERAAAAGVEAIVAVGTTAASSRACVELAARYSSVYAAVGIQPNYVAECGADDWSEIERLATQPRVWPPPVVPRPNRHRRPAPDVAGVAALALRAMLGYRMIEDLHQLEFRNARIAETRAVAPTDRPIGIDFAGPPLEDAGRIAEIAHAVVRNQSLVRQFVRNPAPSVVARLIG